MTDVTPSSTLKDPAAFPKLYSVLQYCILFYKACSHLLSPLVISSVSVGFAGPLLSACDSTVLVWAAPLTPASGILQPYTF